MISTLAALCGVACSSGSKAGDVSTGAITGASTTVRTSPMPADPDAALTCTRDDDCPALACGPCNPGDLVRQRHLVNCKVTPCKNSLPAVCKAGVCVAGAGTSR